MKERMKAEDEYIEYGDNKENIIIDFDNDKNKEEVNNMKNEDEKMDTEYPDGTIGTI